MSDSRARQPWTAAPAARPRHLAEDLAADGEPEREYHPGAASRMARKSVAGGGSAF